METNLDEEEEKQDELLFCFTISFLEEDEEAIKIYKGLFPHTKIKLFDRSFEAAKYGHLEELHDAIKSTANPLLHGKQAILSLGPMQQAYVFEDSRSGCAAFQMNNDARNSNTVQI
ncbi:hypothetical protein F2Q68_00003950 [Brassica cretica]|uniref:Uncharacterized protein n=1 Tax=Brassica cretica TaxID=69181 RepID=A0A8S9JFG9_BRACR|nr:hypothetical protein F2Q68_00003950 [Brassica cretica]